MVENLTIENELLPVITFKKIVVSGNMAKNKVGRSDFFRLTMVLNYAN